MREGAGIHSQQFLWIDTKTGKGFVNEMADRKIRAGAILKVGNKCICFTDSEGVKKLSDMLPKFLERGVKIVEILGEPELSLEVKAGRISEDVSRLVESLGYHVATKKPMDGWIQLKAAKLDK